MPKAKKVKIIIDVFSQKELERILLVLFKRNIDANVFDKQNNKVGEVFTTAKDKNWFVDTEIKF